MHREQAMLVNAQSHKYKGTRQNMLMTMYNNVDQTFWIFYFLCVFEFLIQKQEKVDKKQQCKNIFFKMQSNKYKFLNQASITTKSTQLSKVTNIGSINAWTCCNDYA